LLELLCDIFELADMNQLIERGKKPSVSKKRGKR
jgi:hypothetical protein